MPVTSPADSIAVANTIIMSYDSVVFSIVSKLPDLVSNVGGFTFIKNSSSENADSESQDYTLKFETAIKDLVQSVYNKAESSKQYILSLSFPNRSQNAIGYAYEQLLIPNLNTLSSSLSSVANEILAILPSIDTFNTSTFGAFSIIGSASYKQVAGFLPSNYPLPFIQRTKDFLSSGKEIDSYTTDLYNNSEPATLISQLIQNKTTKIQNINNHVFPTNKELDDIAATYVEPTTAESGSSGG